MPPEALTRPPVAPHTVETVFREVAAEVGLSFTHFAGSTGEFYLPEIMGAGAALFDYDADGDLDVLFQQGLALDTRPVVLAQPGAHSLGPRLFRNELEPTGELRFVDVTDLARITLEAYGQGVAAGDYDNDGYTDLYLTAFGDNVLLHNEGDGTFRDVTAAAGVNDSRWSSSASFCDFDRDGDLDLFVANYVRFTVATNVQCSGAGGRRDYCMPGSYGPVPDALFRNDGGGVFADVSDSAGIAAVPGPGLGVVCADFDGDGDADFFVANDQWSNYLWLNDGDGTFSESALRNGAAVNVDGREEASMGVAVGDLDADGDLDLFLTHLVRETNTLYVNASAGTFFDETDRFALGQNSVAATGFGTGWIDYDNDGDLDLYSANGAVTIVEMAPRDDPWPYAQTNQLFRFDGERYEDVSDRSGAVFALSEVSRGAAFGDIDNDGDEDIVVTNANGPARLLRNEFGRGGHWLSVRLAGTRSPRDGTGARVGVVRDGAPTLWGHAHTDGSYLSASDIRVHFGLGADPAIDRVVVEWPSGMREQWMDVSTDREITLREGDSARGSGITQTNANQRVTRH